MTFSLIDDLDGYGTHDGKGLQGLCYMFLLLP